MTEGEDIRICVLQRGRVVVGRFRQEGAMVVLAPGSRCVRIWGTSGGLEQLAATGPLSGQGRSGRDTVLDAPAPGERTFHVLAVVEIITCKAEAWRAHV